MILPVSATLDHPPSPLPPSLFQKFPLSFPTPLSSRIVFQKKKTQHEGRPSAPKIALLSVSLLLLSYFDSPPAPEVLSPPPGNSLFTEAAVPLLLLMRGIHAVWAAAWIPDSSVGDPSSRDRQLGLRVSASPRRGSLHRRDRQWGPPSFRIPRVELALAVPRRPLAECTSGVT